MLERFRQEKVTVGESPAGGADVAGGQAGASVKYLSSSRLMGLQLRDATFRRHFLLQCLVLMQVGVGGGGGGWACRRAAGLAVGGCGCTWRADGVLSGRTLQSDACTSHNFDK